MFCPWFITAECTKIQLNCYNELKINVVLSDSQTIVNVSFNNRQRKREKENKI